jgi:multicomponent Na+:H+ antiporter subunit C
MEILAPLLVGCLFGTGVFCILRRSLVKMLLGFGLIGQAANLLVFSSGGPAPSPPPLIPPEAAAPLAGFADPLPQALVLTAIVIGFGTTGLFTALIFRASRLPGGDDPDSLRAEEG